MTAAAGRPELDADGRYVTDRVRPSAPRGCPRVPARGGARLTRTDAVFDPAAAAALRAQGADLDVFDAATLGEAERLRELLDQDAALVAATTQEGYTALHLAAWSGQPKAVEVLLARGADPRASADEAGVRPLNSAAAGGDPVVVHLLLDRGAGVDDVQDRDITPLHVAAGRNDLRMVELLLGRGADPSLRTVAGRTAADFTTDPAIRDLLP